MSTVEVLSDQTQWEIIDHNIVGGGGEYVSYIVEVWRGKKRDPATTVSRWVGTWLGEQLEKDGIAFDPDFSGVDPKREMSYSSRLQPKPEPKVWGMIEIVKKADRDAEYQREQQESLLEEGRYESPKHKARRNAYTMFLAAIDRLAAGDESEEVWDDIDSWRLREVRQYER